MQAFLFSIQRSVEDPVLHLIRIVLQVIELIGGHQVDDQLISPVKDTADRLITAKTVVVDLIPPEFHKDVIVCPLSRFQLLIDAFSLEDLWLGHPEDIA